MGVKYDVIFKDGARLSRESVCFGSMAGGHWSFGNHELSNRPANQHSMIQFFTANNIHPIWQEPDFMKNCREWRDRNNPATSKRNANLAYLTEMKLLLDDLPWLHDTLTVHPLVGVVRAHIKNHAADKIITSLFLMRNLCNYGETAACYRHFRAQGLRPRLCAILAHQFTKNFGAMGRCEFSGQYLGEYNWINPQAFGKNAFLQMMRADKDTAFDFIQLPWAEQKGYRRDGFYRYVVSSDQSWMRRSAEEADFNPTEGGWLPFDTRYINAESWNFTDNEAVNPRPTTRTSANYLYTRNVVDAYSISGDVPFDNVMSWSPVWGMTVLQGRNQNRSTQEVMNEYIAELERVCTEAGIPTRL